MHRHLAAGFTPIHYDFGTWSVATQRPVRQLCDLPMTGKLDLVQSGICLPAEIGLHESGRERFSGWSIDLFRGDRCRAQNSSGVDRARLGLIDREREERILFARLAEWRVAPISGRCLANGRFARTGGKS
jgi:hypothetical protein